MGRYRHQVYSNDTWPPWVAIFEPLISTGVWELLHNMLRICHGLSNEMRVVAILEFGKRIANRYRLQKRPHDLGPPIFIFCIAARVFRVYHPSETCECFRLSLAVVSRGMFERSPYEVEHCHRLGIELQRQLFKPSSKSPYVGNQLSVVRDGEILCEPLALS